MDSRVSPFRAAFLPVAKLANIPAENTTEFLYAVFGAAFSFEARSKDSSRRRKFNAAFRAVETDANRLLRTLKFVDKQKGRDWYLRSQFTVRLQDYPKYKEEIIANATKWGEEFESNPDAENPNDDLLDDLERRVEALKKAAHQLTVKRIPKSKSRTKRLMQDVMAAVDKFGGELTYNKNKHTGSLAQVYDFCRARMPAGTWQDLSPSTLQRLKDGHLS